MAWHGIGLNGIGLDWMGWDGMAWNGMEWYGMPCHAMPCHGMIPNDHDREYARTHAQEVDKTGAWSRTSASCEVHHSRSPTQPAPRERSPQQPRPRTPFPPPDVCVQVPPLRYIMKNAVPFARGLGSSSAAIVSGIVAGLILCGHELPVEGEEALLQLAAEIEVCLVVWGLANRPEFHLTTQHQSGGVGVPAPLPPSDRYVRHRGV